MKCELLTYEQRHILNKLGIKEKCNDFFDLFDILPAAIKVGNIIYELSLNKKPYSKNIAYTNKYSNYFVLHVENDDWNEAMIRMCKRLINANYKVGRNFNPMKI